MRDGKTSDGVSFQKPSTTLSTAEAIGVALDSAIHSRYFGSGAIGVQDVARNLVGSIVKEDLDDLQVLKEYLTRGREEARRRRTRPGRRFTTRR